MPDAEAMHKIADAYCDAYARNDKDAVLALFRPDAVFEDPVGQPPHNGHEGIGAFWDQTHALASITLHRQRVVVCGNEMVMLFEVHAVFGDQKMIMDAIDVFVIGEDGLITSLKAYWDPAEGRTVPA